MVGLPKRRSGRAATGWNSRSPRRENPPGVRQRGEANSRLPPQFHRRDLGQRSVTGVNHLECGWDTDL